jgi:hypothetical protein
MNQPYKKFEEVLSVPSRYRILTPQGFKPIKNIMKTIPYEVWYIRLENGDDLKGADTHILFNDKHEQVFIKDIRIGNLIETDKGFSPCVEIKNLGYEANMYDVEIDSEEHEFYANNIVSHNTTVVSLYILWYCLFNESKFVAITAHQLTGAQSVLKDIKYAYQRLPDWLKPGVEEFNARNVKFENGNEIICSPTSADCLRGQSCSLLFSDEFAAIQDSIAEEFYRSNYPTLSKNGKFIIISTPKGTAGKFYELYTEAEKGKNGFKAYTAPWNCIPERDEAWKEKTIKTFGIVAFKREYACEFQGSSFTFISGEALGKLNAKEPLSNPFTGYYIWKKFDRKRVFGASIDLSQGTNRDSSILNIYDVTDYLSTHTYEQVAWYKRNDQKVFEFCEDVTKLLLQWNNPILIAENNGLGLGEVFIKQLYQENGYENLYYDYELAKHGVNANRKTKSLALAHFKEDIENQHQIIHAKEMISELAYFEETRDGIYEARKGENFHDDCVTTGYWMAYLLRSNWAQEQIAYMIEQMGQKPQESHAEDSGARDADILSAFKDVSKMWDQQDFHNEMWLEQDE